MPRDRTPGTREAAPAGADFDADEADSEGGMAGSIGAIYGGLASFLLGRLESFSDSRAEARATRVRRRSAARAPRLASD